jgi:hypothetical protein
VKRKSTDDNTAETTDRCSIPTASTIIPTASTIIPTASTSIPTASTNIPSVSDQYYGIPSGNDHESSIRDNTDCTHVFDFTDNNNDENYFSDSPSSKKRFKRDRDCDNCAYVRHYCENVVYNLENQVSHQNKEIERNNIIIEQLKLENSSLKCQVDILTEGAHNIMSTQSKRVELIKKIAYMENNAICIHGNGGKALTIDNLTNVDPLKVIDSQNPVMVAAIEQFTVTATEHGAGLTGSPLNVVQRKMFQRAMIGECIMGTRNVKYVSALAAVPLILSHCTTGSKKGAEILAHTIPCGSYQTMSDMLNKLVDSPPSTPDDVLAYVLDNNQRVLRTWLCRNFNKQVVDILTNILRVKLKSSNEQFRAELHPRQWRDMSQCPTSFDPLNLTDDMQSQYLQSMNDFLKPLI